MFNFANPGYFWLLLLLPIFIYRELTAEKRSVYYSDLELIKRAAGKDQRWLEWVLLGLKVLAILFFVLALARPQFKTEKKEISRFGVDIMLALDASGSMAAEDFSPNRLASAKKNSQEFILRRENDRLGLVVFGEFSITKCPLTFDHGMLVNIVDKLKLGEVGDSTAIGEAVVTCLNRLRGSDAKSKVIILLTDGENNSGTIGPKEAAGLAKDIGVKIYTIGIGSAEGAPLPVYHPQYGKQYARNPDGSLFLTKLHPDELIEIADLTGGRYFHAQNAADLNNIFSSIDKLEKVKLKSNVDYQIDEKYPFYLFLGFIFMLVEIILSRTILRTTPCI
jgi:Ca-activated chloride channel family protein